MLAKYPLRDFVHIPWVGDPTISDYGQLIYTKLLLNNSLRLCGVIIVIDTILITRILKTENKYLESLLIFSSIGMLGVGLLPVPVTYKPMLNTIHWAFGGFALIGYPVLTAFVIRENNKRLGNFFLGIILGGIAMSLYTYYYFDYQKMHGEIIMGIITLAISIVLNLLYIKELEKKLKRVK